MHIRACISGNTGAPMHTWRYASARAYLLARMRDLVTRPGASGCSGAPVRTRGCPHTSTSSKWCVPVQVYGTQLCACVCIYQPPYLYEAPYRHIHSCVYTCVYLWASAHIEVPAGTDAFGVRINMQGLCVCTNMCPHLAGVHACMRVGVRTYILGCRHSCTYTYIYIYIYMPVYPRACEHACIYSHTRAHVCVHAPCTHMCVHIRARAHLYMRTCAYVGTCTRTHAHPCVYIHMISRPCVHGPKHAYAGIPLCGHASAYLRAYT